MPIFLSGKSCGNREQLPREMSFQEEDTSLSSDAPMQQVCRGQPDILTQKEMKAIRADQLLVLLGGSATVG